MKKLIIFISLLLFFVPSVVLSGPLQQKHNSVIARLGAVGGAFGPELLTDNSDLTAVAWSTSFGTKVDATTFIATGVGGRVYQAGIATTEGTSYTFSFTASVESGGTTTGYAFWHRYSADGNTTVLTLTETPTKYEVTILGKIGDGTMEFGIRDDNASAWNNLTVENFSAREVL